MPVWPHQEAAPYAIAVRAAGERAYLYGESVIALLGLAPTDPTRMWVASPDRVRRGVGEGVTVLGMRPEARTGYYDGVRCQHVAGAVMAAAPRLGADRALEAAAACREGYITKSELEELEGAIA